MDGFDIGRLTDVDFEAVCKDLFERQLKMRLEIYAPGRDQGVDLRHLAPNAAHPLVIQCKLWDRKSAASLIRHLEKVELPKIMKLNPHRYILATSVDLSKGATDKIFKLLHPYVTTPDDIYGLRRIVAMLRHEPQVVERNFRLWLSSTAVLTSLMNKKTLTRSADLADEIEEAARIYVPNHSYKRARELLETRHYCIVVGLPGIGKTTLAKMLAATYAATDYSVYHISEDADEMNALWDPSVSQFFYYDDFLGQNTLADKLHKNEDSRLLRLFERIERSENKRLVLTTRDYLLEQARQRYERLDSEDLGPLKCVIDLGDYNPVVRASIVYNHMFFSRLSSDSRVYFSNPQVYLPIIEHPNFNPRLVERSLSLSIRDGNSGPEVARNLIDDLDHPSGLWERVLAGRLDALSVDLLTVLFSLDGISDLKDLQLALAEYAGTPVDSRTIKRFLKILESTMLKITPGSSGTRGAKIEFHNPSIRDYMRDFLSEYEDLVERLIRTAPFFEQIISLWEVAHSREGAGIARPLYAATDALCSAVIRTFRESPVGPHVRKAAGRDGYEVIHEVDKIKRLTFVLQMTEHLENDALLQFALAQLSDTNFYDESYDGGYLVEAVRTVWKSPIPEIAGHAERVLSEALEWLTSDLDHLHREEIEYQRSRLYSLGDIVPEEAYEKIEFALNRDAQEWLEWFTFHGDIRSKDLEDVRAIIKRLEALYGNADEVLAAKDALRRAQSSIEPNDVPLAKESVPAKRTDMLEVQRIFSALRSD